MTIDDKTYHVAVDEFTRLMRSGDTPDPSAFASKFPNARDALTRELPAVQLLESLKQTPPSDAQVPTQIPVDAVDGYTIKELIGQGAMGAVYRASQTGLTHDVAIKFLLPHKVSDWRSVDRFALESETIAGLHHPNIVPVLKAGKASEFPYFVMKYIDGASLIKFVRAKNPSRLPLFLAKLEGNWTAIAEIGANVADALHSAHKNGMIHRDIKPSNLLIDKHGMVWVTDFGLVKDNSTGSDLSAIGDAVGTPRYMAPEQLRGISDARSDVYSLGITLYELITRAPAINDDAMSSAIAHGKTPFTPANLEQVGIGVPKELADIVAKACNPDPERRYQSAEQLRQALNRFRFGGEAITDRRSEKDKSKDGKRQRSNGARKLAVGILAGLTLAIGLVPFWPTGNQDPIQAASVPWNSGVARSWLPATAFYKYATRNPLGAPTAEDSTIRYIPANTWLAYNNVDLNQATAIQVKLRKFSGSQFERVEVYIDEVSNCPLTTIDVRNCPDGTWQILEAPIPKINGSRKLVFRFASDALEVTQPFCDLAWIGAIQSGPSLGDHLEVRHRDIDAVENRRFICKINDNPKCTFKIVGGRDRHFFSLKQETGDLEFAASRDFEQPSDRNFDNVYELVVEGTWPKVKRLISLNVRVTEKPKQFRFADGMVLNRNCGDGVTFVPLRPHLKNAQQAAYKIVGGPDAALFGIESNDGVVASLARLSTNKPADFDKDNRYEFEIAALPKSQVKTVIFGKFPSLGILCRTYDDSNYYWSRTELPDTLVAAASSDGKTFLCLTTSPSGIVACRYHIERNDLEFLSTTTNLPRATIGLATADGERFTLLANKEGSFCELYRFTLDENHALLPELIETESGIGRATSAIATIDGLYFTHYLGRSAGYAAYDSIVPPNGKALNQRRDLFLDTSRTYTICGIANFVETPADAPAEVRSMVRITVKPNEGF